MGANRNTKLDRVHRKKKKKSKKLKNLKSKACEDNRVTNVVLKKPLTGKIPDLIQETLSHTTREKIIQLLFQVKDKAEHCYDFDISFWLQKFLEIGGDVNLIEAAYLIVNAGHIYERKVDLLYELVRRSAESSRDATDETGKKTHPEPKTRRKITRQAVSLHDRLYESEMLTKQFKQMSTERITEQMSAANHKAPSHFFKKWVDYKVWRQNHKKKMRCPVPYSTLCDDLYLHSAMWGLSCIEDFDYDDDLDTKRNYRMFTHHMEHRYNTVVPDVNFIMHFKVKDFIEAEEDEIEMMKILDLPAPPTRQWPPFCRTLYTKEYAKETFNVDIGESAEDYIKKYVDLEDIVLEKQTYEIDRELLLNAIEAQKNHSDNLSGKSPEDLIYEQLRKIIGSRHPSNDADKNANTNESAMENNGQDTVTEIEQVNNVDTQTVDKEPENNVGSDVTVAAPNDSELIPLEDSHFGDDDLTDVIPSTDNDVTNNPSQHGNGEYEVIDTSATIASENNLSQENVQPVSISGSLDEVSQETEALDASVSALEVVSENQSISQEDVQPVSISGSLAEVSQETEALDASVSAPEVVSENQSIARQTPIPDDSAVERIASDLARALTSNSPVNNRIATKSPGPNDPSNTSPTVVIIDDLENSTANLHKNASSIILENIKNNISDQIVIRVSVDEGIAFSELDDLDKAMLSPVVELIDIFNPIKEEVLDCEDLNFAVESCGFRNILGIDERYLCCQENFSLPLDIIYKESELRLNIFGLPEAKLRRRIHFALPAEFDMYMSNRNKRKCNDRSESRPTKMIKVFKLNEQDMRNVHITPPSTPNRDDDFLGFDASEISFSDILSSTLDLSILEKSNLFPSTTNRSISRDSGIGLSTLGDSQLLNSTIAECDESGAITNSFENISPESESTLIREHAADEIVDILDGFVDDNGELIVPPSELSTVPGDKPPALVAPTESSIADQSLSNNLDVMESDRATVNDSNMTSKDIPASSDSAQTKQKSLQDNIEFEQNLYEKCRNNEKVEKRVSEVNQMADRIQKWHRYLRPILAVSMERHHFDIYGIGTDIMKTFPTEESVRQESPVISLDNVMEGRDPTFLSRYFLSMLQLTNAGNVDITLNQRDPNKPTPLNDINLKLISRERHTVAIEDDIGSRVSRKRPHSTIDDSDSSSENDLPLCVISKSNLNGSVPAHKLNPKASSTPTTYATNNKNLSSTSTVNRSMPNSQPSTSFSTAINRPISVHETNVQRKSPPASTMTSQPLGINQKIVYSSQIVSSKIHSTSIVNNPDKLSSNNIVNMKNLPTVSKSALISIYRCNQVVDNEKNMNSNNLLDFSQNDETFSSEEQFLEIAESTESPLKELPPFSSIKRYDMKSVVSSGEKQKNQNISQNMNDSMVFFSFPSSSQSTRMSAALEQSGGSSSISSYPNLIRTQDNMFATKHSRFGNDDLDSGIFSEFSINENNSVT